MAFDTWKILRSLTSGLRPSGRTYGEVYVNLGDNQFGVFDNSNMARDLIGVPMFSSARSYVTGNVVNFQGALYSALGSVSPGTFNATQWSQVATLKNISAIGNFGGYLSMLDSSHIIFKPYKGANIIINGSSYPIPAAGIMGPSSGAGCFIDGVSGGTLAANTVYNVYLFNNAGTLTIDFSQTGHITSSTAGNIGVEIKSGNDSRSLIGKVRTSVGTPFSDQPNARLVLSWFNRRTKYLNGGPVTTAGTPVFPADLGGYCYFCSWGDESLFFGLNGVTLVSNDVPGQAYLGIGLDSVTGATASAQYIDTISEGYSAYTANSFQPSEGYHYATVAGGTLSATITFFFTLVGDGPSG